MRKRSAGRLSRFAAIVQKEMIQSLRDWHTVVAILAIPLIELFLFAYAINLRMDHIPTAVADMSLDDQSRAFVKALEVSEYFDIEMFLADETAAIQAIDLGQVRASVVIPPDFAEQVERGQAQVLVLLDGTDSFTVRSGYGAVSAIAQVQSMKALVKKVERMGARVGTFPITSAIHILYNPNMDGMFFLVPAMVAMLLQYMTINMTAMAVVREHELGTIEQILITPVRPMELMVGKLIPNILLSILNMLTVTLAGVFVFGVPFKGDPWLFAWLSLLFLVSGLGLGLLISTLAKTQHEAQEIGTLIMLLSMLLSGFMYPRSPMPPVVRAVGDFLPLTYFVRIVRGIFTKGIGLTFLWSDVLVLAGYAMITMIIAAATFKKRLD